MFSLKGRLQRLHPATSTDFYEYLSALKEHERQKMERGDLKLIELSQRALLGEREAVLFALSEIEKYLREQPFTADLPPAYSHLDTVGALFHEWMGYATACKWMLEPAYSHSANMQIIGKQLFYSERGEYKLYENEFSSLDRVDQLIRAVVRHDPQARYDRSNPSAELKIDDPLWPGRFLRVAVWGEPRVWREFPTITMRRQIVEYLSLEDQVGTGLIPGEALPMIRALVKTHRNTIVAGPVGSGKTTFANTIVGEQLKQADHAVGTVMIEKHPESILPYLPVAKRHRYIPIVAKDDELMDVGIESLRHDPEIVFMTEMRFREWQFYNFAGEKGYTGLIGTYHTTDAEDIPYQGAFAVYANVGGHLRGHMLAALKSCEVIAILEPERGGKKRLTRLCEICYDPNEQRVFSRDWMLWDRATGEWAYSDEISSAMKERMEKHDIEAARIFQNELSRLSALRRLDKPLTESLKSNAILAG